VAAGVSIKGLDKKMSTKLHHIGLAVPSISEWAKVFSDIGLVQRNKPEPDPIQKVNALFVNVQSDHDIYVELLEPTDESSPITRFLNKRGGGLHHLCFEIDNIEATISKLTGSGFQMLSGPVECVGIDRTFGRQGDHPTRIAFLMAKGQVLIELLER